MMVTEYEIRFNSRRAAGEVAQALAVEGISFRYDYSGGLVAAYITIVNPSEKQLMFLKYHYKLKRSRIDINQTHLL